MGLDTVELVMEVERAFAIEIDDRDAERILTVGDLYRYVLAKLEGKASGTSTPSCMSAAVFYRLRRALNETLGIERERVRPSTDLDALIPLKDRRRVWLLLEDKLELDLPGLLYPDWVVLILYRAMLSMLVSGLLIAIAWLIPGFPHLAAPWSFLSSLLLATLILIVTKPLASRLSAECRSVRGFVVRTAALNYESMMANKQWWNEHEVWEAVRTLVGVQVDVEPGRLSDETSFVYDLGLD